MVLIALAGLTAGRPLALRGAAIVGVALVIAGIGLALIPTPKGKGSLGATVDRLGSFAGTVGGGVSGRIKIWQTSAGIIASRPWFEGDDGGPTVLRHLFGYGPDTFLYVYPLEMEPSQSSSIGLVKDGHNQWVHAAVELGIVGAVLLLAVAALPLLAGTHLLLFRSRSWAPTYRLIAAALLAALAGRGVEQLSGIAQISDALPRIIAWRDGPQPATRPALAGPALRAMSGGAAAIIVISIGSLTLVHTWSNVLGARDAALSATATREEGDLPRAIELIGSAVNRAPATVAYG